MRNNSQNKMKFGSNYPHLLDQIFNSICHRGQVIAPENVHLLFMPSYFFMILVGYCIKSINLLIHAFMI